jgi:hypothetical protein
MSERFFNEYRLERQMQRFEYHFFVGRRIGADAHHVCWTDSEHFSEIGKKLKSRKFNASSVPTSGRRSARATSS